MKRWVVTGPAGAGKSALCDFFVRRGAALVEGDLLGHEVLSRPDIVAACVAEFGSRVAIGGAVDRRALGSIVFSDPMALDRLNGITHGPLSELAALRLDELGNQGRHRLAVLEAAVYFLLPPVHGIDLVICVMSTVSNRLARLTGQGRLTWREARSRIRAQQALKDGWARADVILANDGTLPELEESAEALWARLAE